MCTCVRHAQTMCAYNGILMHIHVYACEYCQALEQKRYSANTIVPELACYIREAMDEHHDGQRCPILGLVRAREERYAPACAYLAIGNLHDC